MPSFDINTEAAIKYSADLERLHRSALPSAVRNTLNNAAFETKKQLPMVASRLFITRQKSFFRRFSTVDKASGFNINSMRSIVGINASVDAEIAKNLESQEFGGAVQGNKLVPHNHARTSKSLNKRVAARNRFNRVKIHDASRAYRAHRGTKKSKFIAAVMSTAKSGKNHMMIKNGNRGMVYEVTSVSQNVRTGKVNFKIKKLYSVRSNKTHRVKASGFMMKSSKIASSKINDFYRENAEFQIKKFMK